MKTLKANADYLSVLRRTTPRGRKALIKEAPPGLIKALSECCNNALYNPRLRLPANKLRKLRPYKKAIRTVAHARTSIGRKRRVLQKGGFLGVLLSTLAPILASVIGSAVK